jgi:hypothetical protein
VAKTELEKLCESHQVRITCKFVDTVRGTPDEPDWQHHEYKCTLHYAGRKLTTTFRQGTGHSNEPTAADVLACLTSDASSGEMSFSEFCDNFAYNPDSIKAHKTWRTCRTLAARVRKFLGKRFDTFASASH